MKLLILLALLAILSSCAATKPMPLEQQKERIEQMKKTDPSPHHHIMWNERLNWIETQLDSTKGEQE